MFDDNTVKALVKQTGDLDEDIIRRVLTALQAIRDGAPVGTIATNPKTGAVALRVSEDGVAMWKVTAPDGSEWRDMQPALKGWTLINDPAATKKEG